MTAKTEYYVAFSIMICSPFMLISQMSQRHSLGTTAQEQLAPNCPVVVYGTLAYWKVPISAYVAEMPQVPICITSSFHTMLLCSYRHMERPVKAIGLQSRFVEYSTLQ